MTKDQKIALMLADYKNELEALLPQELEAQWLMMKKMKGMTEAEWAKRGLA